MTYNYHIRKKKKIASPSLFTQLDALLDCCPMLITIVSTLHILSVMLKSQWYLFHIDALKYLYLSISMHLYLYLYSFPDNPPGTLVFYFPKYIMLTLTCFLFLESSFFRDFNISLLLILQVLDQLSMPQGRLL